MPHLPQGKGGPEATFCVRRTKSSQIHRWRILMLYIKFETKSYQLLLCHKFADFWQVERDRIRTETRTDGHTYGRTNIDFFGPPYTKSPKMGLFEMGFVTFENLHKVPKWDPIFLARVLYTQVWGVVKVQKASFQKVLRGGFIFLQIWNPESVRGGGIFMQKVT